MTGTGRRAVLAGAAAWLAAPALRAATPAEPLDAILAASGLGPLTGFALADLRTGALVEAHRAEARLPPASVAKIVMSLYALEALGPGWRFGTRVLGTGPVEAGVLRGDLVLAGGGDPLLDTDALGDLVAALKRGGLRRVEGRLRVAVGALPAAREIDRDQPEEAAYNPAVSGLNLNFNRVFLAWKEAGGGPALAFSAPGERFQVPLASITAELSPGGLPRHRLEGGREVWRLARESLRGRGSLWLPVRVPGIYAGEVLGRLAAGAGLGDLPPAEVVAAAAGAVMAERASPSLAEMLRDMLRFSTNLTAETIGLSASRARGGRPEGIGGSAAAMTRWARGRFGLSGARFVNHSGLSVRSEVSAAELLRVLASARGAGLPELLPERPILDAARKPVEIGGVRVHSKTGTMDFVSALAGYLDGARPLAFAILAADPGRRARIRPEDRDRPPGGADWTRRARAQEQALLRRWATLHG